MTDPNRSFGILGMIVSSSGFAIVLSSALLLLAGKINSSTFADVTQIMPIAHQILLQGMTHPMRKRYK
jgi:hypothetical protein